MATRPIQHSDNKLKFVLQQIPIRTFHRGPAIHWSLSKLRQPNSHQALSELVDLNKEVVSRHRRKNPVNPSSHRDPSRPTLSSSAATKKHLRDTLRACDQALRIQRHQVGLTANIKLGISKSRNLDNSSGVQTHRTRCRKTDNRGLRRRNSSESVKVHTE